VIRRLRTRASITAALAGLVVSSVAFEAAATPRLEVAHVQGRDAPWIVGWNEAVVSLENAGGPSFRGEVLIETSFDPTHERPTLRVPVSLAAGESARLVLPFFLQPGAAPQAILRTQVDGEVASHPLGVARPFEGVATLVEIQGKDAFGKKLLDGAPDEKDKEPEEGVYPPPPTHKHHPHPKAGPTHPVTPTIPYVRPTIDVVTVQFAKESGDPILPDVVAGWSGAVLVVVPSDILSRLSGRPLDALVGWVRAGGLLAVSVVREEDLRAPNLEKLFGTGVRMTGTSPMTFAGDSLTRGDLSKGGDDGDYARVGIGQAWLLRRDPWAKGKPDPKSAAALQALWGSGLSRRPAIASGPVGAGVRFYDDDRVRKLLDPNHGFRPALGLAALLVLGYALLVGPVGFARARRLGRPLSVLRTTPLIALVLFLSLVGIGKAGKGIRGRIRRLTVVDVAGGATAGQATALDAYFVSDPGTIVLAGKRPIDTVHVVEPFQESAAIELDKGTVAVRGVRAHPWETIVLASEGEKEVPGGIVLEGSGPRLALENKTPWTLEHVVLHPETTLTGPAKSRYFAVVKPGEKVFARDGEAVERHLWPVAAGSLAGAGAGLDSAAGRPLLKDKGLATEALAAGEALLGSSWAGAGTLSHDLSIATAVVRLPTPPLGGLSTVSLEHDVLLLRVIGLGGGKGKGELEKDPKEKVKEKDL